MSSSGDGTQWVKIPKGAISDAINNAIPNWVQAIGELSKQGAATATALIRNPIKFIMTTVILWFLNAFVFPVFNAILAGGRAIVRAITTVFDVAAGTATWTSTTLIGVVAVVPRQVFGVIGEFNMALAQLAATAGLGAPPIVAALYIAEVAAAIYVIWAIIEALQLGPYLRIVAKPLRALLSFTS